MSTLYQELVARNLSKSPETLAVMASVRNTLLRTSKRLDQLNQNPEPFNWFEPKKISKKEDDVVFPDAERLKPEEEGDPIIQKYLIEVLQARNEGLPIYEQAAFERLKEILREKAEKTNGQTPIEHDQLLEDARKIVREALGDATTEEPNHRNPLKDKVDNLWSIDEKGDDGGRSLD